YDPHAHGTTDNVKAALELLSAIGSTNVAVTGSGTLADPFQIQFINDLADEDSPPIVMTTSGFPTTSVTPETTVDDAQNERFKITIEPEDASSTLATAPQT